MGTQSVVGMGMSEKEGEQRMKCNYCKKKIEFMNGSRIIVEGYIGGRVFYHSECWFEIIVRQNGGKREMDKYLLEQRSRIDDFMKNQWIPKFMESFTKESGVIDKLEKTSDVDEKNKILQEFGEEANKRIEERRTALVDVLYKCDGFKIDI